MKRHQCKCNNNTKFRFKGGFLEKPKTIFEELAFYGIKVPEIMYDKFATYDFESILEKIEEKAEGIHQKRAEALVERLEEARSTRSVGYSV